MEIILLFFIFNQLRNSHICCEFAFLKAESKIFPLKVVSLEDSNDWDSLFKKWVVETQRKVSQATIEDMGYVNTLTTASFTLTFRSSHNFSEA